MKSPCLPIALVLLVTCANVFAQDSATNTNPARTAQSSPSDSGAVHGIYPSGFAIPAKGKNNKIPVYDPMQVLAAVRGNWYPRIPELQKSSQMREGTTVIEHEIKNDGSLEKLKTIKSSGSSPQDAAAEQAIESSSPFAPFPEDYHEKALKLQMYFGYNQQASAEAPFCDGPDWGAHAVADTPVYRAGNGVKAPHAKCSPAPEYSEEARREKYQSEVMVAGTVDANGRFTDLCLVQAAGFGLDEQAMRTLRTWQFEPGTQQEQPVAVRLTVEMTFRLY